MSLFGVLGIAGSGMAAEAQRLAAVASNLANADSALTSAGRPYRAREVVFQAMPLDGRLGGPASTGMAGVRVAAVVESSEPLRRVYDPGNRLADAEGYLELPNVNPVDEIVNMISAQQNYQANLEAFNVAKSLALRTIAI
jgi:flagellar basal-body rod protein FlgC